MDVHKAGYFLKLFLYAHKQDLLPEHFEELLAHYEFLLTFKDSVLIKTEDKGYHWSICPYIEEGAIDSFPETCCCISAQQILRRIDKLKSLYKRMTS